MRHFPLLILLLFWGCTEKQADWTRVPDAPGSLSPVLVRGFDGESLHLLWQQKGSSTHTSLQLSDWKKDHWAAPRETWSGKDWFVNWADFPRICEIREGKWAAHFLQKNNPETYAYQVKLLFSEDNGTVWQGPVIPHERQTATEHGFVSLLSWKKKLFLVWLDGRAYAPKDSLSPDSLPPPQMSLRAAQYSPDGKKEKEWLLDERVCDCCQTAVALNDAGPLIAYRDRDSNEVRDISVIRWLERGRRFSQPQRIGQDYWQINACPVNGPALAAHGQQVAVAWYSEAHNQKQVQIALSQDAGKTFSPAQNLSPSEALGRVALDVDPDGQFWLSWLQSQGSEALLHYTRLNDSGQATEIRSLGPLDPSRNTGFPQMRCYQDQLIFAWTQGGDSSRVVVRAVER